MKRILIATLMAAAMLLTGNGLRVLVLTPTPQMHCASCENKIKQNMRFEKGVKRVETNIEKQEVSITYDPSKNTAEGLQAGMKKIGYDTRVVSDRAEKKEQGKKKR